MAKLREHGVQPQDRRGPVRDLLLRSRQLHRGRCRHQSPFRAGAAARRRGRRGLLSRLLQDRGRRAADTDDRAGLPLQRHRQRGREHLALHHLPRRQPVCLGTPTTSDRAARPSSPCVRLEANAAAAAVAPGFRPVRAPPRRPGAYRKPGESGSRATSPRTHPGAVSYAWSCRT